MRSGFSSFIWFIIGIIIGAAALWIVAHFVVIPGIKATSTNTNNAGQSVQQSQQTNSGNKGSNQNNQMVTDTKSLVSGFPGDVPVYQPSALTASTKSSRGGNAVSYSASYTSTNPTTDVINYYKDQLGKNGWHTTSQNQDNGISVIEASKNNEQANVLISPLSTQAGGAQSSFQLAVTPAR